MKKQSTQRTVQEQNNSAATPNKETVTQTQGTMKKLVTTTLAAVIVHYQGGNHSFKRVKGAVEIDAVEIGNLPESLALVLILLAGARKLYLARDTYMAISDGVWFHIDREKGGLNPEAEELFADDEDVLAAAALHRQAQSSNPKTQ